MYIYYNRKTSVSGRALRDQLDIPGGTRPPQEREDFLIRWGESGAIRYKPDNILNSRRAIAIATDKRQSIRVMREGHTRVPDLFDSREGNIEIPVTAFPVLGRKVNHTQGSDIVVCMQRSDVVRALEYNLSDYFVRYIPTSREFRLHVFQDEVIKVSEKVLTDLECFSRPWVRNHGNGYTFRNPRDIPPRIMEALEYESIVGVQSLGLDFGAVDAIVGDDGSITVLEVNSGPALEGNTLDLYTEKLRGWLQTGILEG